MKSEIKVIVAEDHDLYRDGLTNLLLATAGMHFCGSAGNGEELVALVRQNRPDVIITDLMMPVMDGIEAIREIMKMEPPHPVILVLSTFDSERFIIDALVAGAHGYVIKNAAREEIIEAIRTINEGDY
ncbi:MAG TPA: response regulator transcription factor, partial [Candidatus Babeliaceae bacterium]|nr:response regulator transcription factor [Candidatus Babeliaceae bacterium]